MDNKMPNEENEKKLWSYKDWYAENKQDLSDKRRSRYQSDPEYKEKVLAQNRAYREKKAAETAGVARSRTRTTKRRKPVVMLVELFGNETHAQLTHVGGFASAIQKSVATIHQWERVGLLPKTPFVVAGKSKQERLYTMEMIQVVLAALEARNGQVSSSDKKFYEDIENGWKAAGVSIKEN